MQSKGERRERIEATVGLLSQVDDSIGFVFLAVCNSAVCLRRVQAEAIFCLFKDADRTFELAQSTVEELKMLDSVPNLAGLYANFSTLYYMKSEYEEAYQWAKKAIGLLDEKLPTRCKFV